MGVFVVGQSEEYSLPELVEVKEPAETSPPASLGSFQFTKFYLVEYKQ